MRSTVASVDLEDTGSFLPPPLPPPPELRESYVSLPEVHMFEAPPVPPPPELRSSFESLQGLEDALQDAFFKAGEELDRVYRAQARAWSEWEGELSEFLSGVRRRRLQVMVMLLLAPLSVLAVAALVRVLG